MSRDPDNRPQPHGPPLARAVYIPDRQIWNVEVDDLGVVGVIEQPQHALTAVVDELRRRLEIDGVIVDEIVLDATSDGGDICMVTAYAPDIPQVSLATLSPSGLNSETPPADTSQTSTTTQRITQGLRTLADWMQTGAGVDHAITVTVHICGGFGSDPNATAAVDETAALLGVQPVCRDRAGRHEYQASSSIGPIHVFARADHGPATSSCSAGCTPGSTS